MRVAIDTGGTFTKDPSQAILEALKQINKENLEALVHGSTVGTNAFLERKGAKTAFITTYGFAVCFKFERASTTAINVYFLLVIGKYFKKFPKK